MTPNPKDKRFEMVQIRPLNQQHIGVEGSNISAPLESGSRLYGTIGDAALRMARSEGSAGDRLELTGGDSALSSGGSGTKGSGGDLVLEHVGAVRVDGGVRVAPESARVQDVDFVYGLKTGLYLAFEETLLSHLRRISLEVAHAYRLGKYEQILVGIRWVHIYSRYCTSG